MKYILISIRNAGRNFDFFSSRKIRAVPLVLAFTVIPHVVANIFNLLLIKIEV